MSSHKSPKYSRIIEAVRQRVEQISPSNGFYTDIGRDIRLDMRTPQISDMPVSLVYAGGRTVESTMGCNSRVEMEINVIGYLELTGEPFLTLGDYIQSDIQRAVELADNSLGGLLRRQYGLTFSDSEIFMPEIGASAVGARVTYSAPHIRITGDPEIK